MSLSIILTCFNETPMIFQSYEKIESMMRLTNIEYELIVVDDGSQPDVQKQLTEYFRDKKKIALILSSANEGRGSAVTKGLKASSMEYAGFIDTDLEIPEYFLFSLYYAISKGDYDIVIGRRVYLLDCRMYSWLRFLYSRLYFLVANISLKLGFLDTESGIKVFKRDKILEILSSVESKGWFWDTEIVAEALRHNLMVTQIPVFVSRGREKSTVNLFRDTRRYLTSIYGYLKRRKRMVYK